MNVSFKICVLRHQQRKDKTFPLNIRIGWQSKYSFLQTNFSIGPENLSRKLSLKNEEYKDKCNSLIREYREIVNEIPNIETMTVGDIREYISHKTSHKNGIDFLLFYRNVLESMKKEESPSLGLYSAGYNHLTKHTDTNSIQISKITPAFLTGFEKYLSENNVGSRGQNLYLGKIRAVYNMCMDEYEPLGYVFAYPFRKYKLPQVKITPTVALTKKQLLTIINCQPKTQRAMRAQGIFCISLIALGINAKDVYSLRKAQNDRIEYERSKTKDKRVDNAFISLNTQPELIPYIEKFKGKNGYLFCFRDWYKNVPQLNKAIMLGLKSIAKQEKIPEFEYYDARRTIASIMRNKLGISKDDIAMCLNHVDMLHKTTDYYIETDFSVIDKCNRKFLDWLFTESQPEEGEKPEVCADLVDKTGNTSAKTHADKEKKGKVSNPNTYQYDRSITLSR